MIRRIFTGPMVILTLLLLLFFSLRIISSAVMDVEQFQQLYYILLSVNLVILCLLVFFISRQAWRLLRHLREHVAGAKLTLRMVIIFVSLAIFPALVVYMFSIHFIHRSIDSWFDVTVESALEDAMTLSRSAVDEKKKTLLRQMRRLSDELLVDVDTITVVTLAEIREKSGVYEVTLMTSKGRVLGSSSIEKDGIVPDIPSSDLLLPLQQGRDHVVLDLNDDSNRMIRVLTRVSINNDQDFLVLQAVAPISERLHRLASSVQQAYSEYKGLVYLRKPLKTTFTLTLSLVLLLGILSAVWAAFYSAKRIAAPIRDLSEGTKAVAEGKYHKPIPILNNDDFGLLIDSFNKMVRRLSSTHKALEESHQQEKRQKDYLEVVLGSLSSGIISLSADQTIRTCNPEVSHILGINVNEYQGQSLLKLAQEKAALKPLVDWIRTAIENRVKHWNEEMTLGESSGRKNLLCRGNALADGGYVIVIENVTSLVQAQRDAAWGEVARRLAHEIKNPLTPIQLSAERLRHKYLRTMQAKDAETLDRLTATIINQVDSMKDMVKAFSEYAKMPELKMQPLEIKKLLTEVVDLYRSNDKLSIEQDLDINGTLIEGDQGRLRQVFHNVIKNALEAAAEREQITLKITAGLLEKDNHHYCLLQLNDDGMGFPEDLLNNIFDPYVTNKPKGTGLGLAIVKKIIEEHGGSILAENAAEGGAKITIQLPVVFKEVKRLKTEN